MFLLCKQIFLKCSRQRSCLASSAHSQRMWDKLSASGREVASLSLPIHSECEASSLQMAERLPHFLCQFTVYVRQALFKWQRGCLTFSSNSQRTYVRQALYKWQIGCLTFSAYSQSMWDKLSANGREFASLSLPIHSVCEASCLQMAERFPHFLCPFTAYRMWRKFLANGSKLPSPLTQCMRDKLSIVIAGVICHVRYLRYLLRGW